MEVEAKPDFSGYATKAGLKCSDGRTIMPDAFKHQDKETVPLVWQHSHNEPSNVLGHATLEHREDGVYVYGFFNETAQAQNAKTLIQHKDIKSLSIYANQLVERAKQVFHGYIREVSLVLSGANPGALIDNITLAHADGDMVTLEDEAIIYTGLDLAHSDEQSTEKTEETKTETKSTSQEVYDAMTSEQKEVVHQQVSAAVEETTKKLAAKTEETKTEVVHEDKNNEEGRRMSRNVFEQKNGGKEEEKHVLTHDAIQGIVADAQKSGSLREAVEAYALKHGIENIEILFPDAKSLDTTPQFDKRRTEWVSSVINGTRHSPFSRVKTLVADITFDEARARGYVKGNLKKEEYFGVSKRTTSPQTIYKKQKLDRDDIVDITDFDVVTWLKAEMRLMLDEELARAVLIGDGRDVSDEDKIKDPAGAVDGVGIRSILNDHELYVAKVNINIGDANSTPLEVADAIVGSMRLYKGTGSPTMFISQPNLTYMLLARDEVGHRYWKTAAELASELGVNNIVPVEVMESDPDLFCIIVNLSDYTIGADKGGEVNFFDDFDIDYNQYKYLYETRLSGGLTKIRSALVVHSQAGTDVLVTPNAPTFNADTGAITIVNTANVVYKRADTDAVVNAAGSPYTVAAGESLTIYAEPAAGYYFADNIDDSWTFHHEH